MNMYYTSHRDTYIFDWYMARLVAKNGHQKEGRSYGKACN